MGSIESGSGACEGYSAGRHGGFCWADMELADLIDNGFGRIRFLFGRCR